ncbi:MAG TPA: GNAT family N-acetyltransferase [Frankiaceae bacterium]|nr:GNAT family N-acetyltransferase [Frankiaceae bacterium]
MTLDVRLRPWSDGDLDLLHAFNAPEMTAHLGGPEPLEKLADRHRRYLALHPPAGAMYVVLAGEERAGSIGWWERVWRDEPIYETGWAVLPSFQGRGVAAAAARAVLREVAAYGTHSAVHAFPSVDHPASNAVCRNAGFVLLGECDFGYPPGSTMRCHDWVADVSR